MKQLRYILEAILLYAFWGLCKIMPAAWASNMGGFLGRVIGPMFLGNDKILKNLAIALPDLSDNEKNKIVRGAWDNMGRVMAEYPHIKHIGQSRVDIVVDKTSERLVKSGDAIIFITIHSSNWEVSPAALLYYFDRPVHPTLRTPNNPYSAALLDFSRRFDSRIDTIAKSRASGRAMMQKMKEKETLGILIDQKLNEGVNIPFFGHDAKTTTIYASLAQKYKAPVIPVSSKRLGAARYEVTVHAPLQITDETGENLPIEDIAKNTHMMIENWIKDTPQEWMWMHRRWPRELYKD